MLGEFVFAELLVSAAVPLETAHLQEQMQMTRLDRPLAVVTGASTGIGSELMRGDGDAVSGWQNKLQSAIASITPAGVLAEQHRKQAEPGSANY